MEKEQLNSEDIEEIIELLIEAKENGEDLNEVIKHIDLPKDALAEIEAIITRMESMDADSNSEDASSSLWVCRTIYH